MTEKRKKEQHFDIHGYSHRVSCLTLMPGNAHCFLVFGHGAGAGMEHPFMASVAQNLADRGVGSLRYQFPYMGQRGRRPDPKPVLLATVRSALEKARSLTKLPLIVGGKSMGGRMSSQALAERPEKDVLGVAFFGFPLHSPGSPSDSRAEHLAAVSVPMLFLQGSRDTLADLALLKPVCKKLGKRARLHVIDDADHSFHVPRKSGRTDADILEELAEVFVDWSKMELQITVS